MLFIFVGKGKGDTQSKKLTKYHVPTQGGQGVLQQAPEDLVASRDGTAGACITDL